MNVIEKTRAVASQTMNWAKSKTATVVAIGTAGAAAVQPAHAAAIDVTDVVADIAAQAAPVAAIGSAVLILFVGIKAFKWVRRALS